VYCPAGSEAPTPAGAGYFTEGPAGNRFARVQCIPGLFCPGDGRAYACPAGRYGDTPGLTNATCTGTCADGVLCNAQTASAAGRACPTGQYCVAGLAQACPSGTYNPTPGAVNVSQCLLCPARTFNAGTGSSSEAECLPCPEHEGSNPGASACWPGVLGAARLRHALGVRMARALLRLRTDRFPQCTSACFWWCVCCAVLGPQPSLPVTRNRCFQGCPPTTC
jgi:hypothetical protein